ncbi:hypothetical protein U6K92_12510, partial [Cutibacterium acnes]
MKLSGTTCPCVRRCKVSSPIWAAAQKALGHVSPIQAMKQWQRSHPELFNRRVTNQPGHDSRPADAG